MSAIQSENGNTRSNFAPGAKTRVIFADDHKIFRQALVGLIEGEGVRAKDLHPNDACNGDCRGLRSSTLAEVKWC